MHGFILIIRTSNTQLTKLIESPREQKAGLSGGHGVVPTATKFSNSDLEQFARDKVNFLDVNLIIGFRSTKLSKSIHAPRKKLTMRTLGQIVLTSLFNLSQVDLNLLLRNIKEVLMSAINIDTSDLIKLLSCHFIFNFLSACKFIKYNIS